MCEPRMTVMRPPVFKEAETPMDTKACQPEPREAEKSG